MTENIKWAISGLIVGMVASGIIVSTNKSVQNYIIEKISKTKKKYNKVKSALKEHDDSNSEDIANRKEKVNSK